MTTTLKEVKPCAQCDAHDAETKRLMRLLFDQDEMGHISLLVAMNLKTRMDLRDRMPENDLRRLTVQRDVDFAAQMLGKIFVSFEPKYLAGIKAHMRQLGVSFEIRHTPCPHGESANAEAAP